MDKPTEGPLDVKTWADVRDLTHDERMAYIKTLPVRLIFGTIEEWERDAKAELLMSVLDFYADAAAGIAPGAAAQKAREEGKCK